MHFGARHCGANLVDRCRRDVVIPLDVVKLHRAGHSAGTVELRVDAAAVVGHRRIDTSDGSRPGRPAGRPCSSRCCPPCARRPRRARAARGTAAKRHSKHRGAGRTRSRRCRAKRLSSRIQPSTDLLQNGPSSAPAPGRPETSTCGSFPASQLAQILTSRGTADGWKSISSGRGLSDESWRRFAGVRPTDPIPTEHREAPRAEGATDRAAYVEARRAGRGHTPRNLAKSVTVA